MDGGGVSLRGHAGNGPAKVVDALLLDGTALAFDFVVVGTTTTDLDGCLVHGIEGGVVVLVLAIWEGGAFLLLMVVMLMLMLMVVGVMIKVVLVGRRSRGGTNGTSG